MVDLVSFKNKESNIMATLLQSEDKPAATKQFEGESAPPAIASEAVLVKSDEKYCQGKKEIQGFSEYLPANGAQIDYEKLLDSMLTSGFQAQNYGR